MYHIVESKKSFEQAAADLEAAVSNHHFSVLHVFDLGKTLRKRGLEFAEQCRVFEVCNPFQAAAVLSADMKLNMALPCRVSVYTETGETRIGFVLPKSMLAALSSAPDLLQVADEVEQALLRMLEEAK